MALPNTDIKLSEIYWEAQFGGGSGNPGSPISFKELASASYFDGPNGDSIIAYNAWGQSTLSGANRIYNLSAKTADYSMGDFRDLTYFYENSSYKIGANVNNNYSPSVPPNPPNDIDVTVTFYDSNGSYPYAQGNSGPVPEGGGNSNFDVTVGGGNEPILAVGYWEIEVTANGFGICDININGTAVVTTGPLNPGSNIFNWGSYQSVNAAFTSQGYEGFYVEINAF